MHTMVLCKFDNLLSLLFKILICPVSCLQQLNKSHLTGLNLQNVRLSLMLKILTWANLPRKIWSDLPHGRAYLEWYWLILGDLSGGWGWGGVFLLVGLLLVWGTVHHILIWWCWKYQFVKWMHFPCCVDSLLMFTWTCLTLSALIGGR